MKNGNIKTIFFDAADTLFYIERGLGNTYASVAKKYGGDPHPLARFAAGVATWNSIKRQHHQFLLFVRLPDEFVQAGLRPGFFINLFDDDRTV